MSKKYKNDFVKTNSQNVVKFAKNAKDTQNQVLKLFLVKMNMLLQSKIFTTHDKEKALSLNFYFISIFSVKDSKNNVGRRKLKHKKCEIVRKQFFP